MLRPLEFDPETYKQIDKKRVPRMILYTQVLPTTKSDEEGAYKMPGGYFIPAASAVAVLWFLSSLPRNELVAMVIFLVLFSVVYVTMKLGRSKRGFVE